MVGTEVGEGSEAGMDVVGRVIVARAGAVTGLEVVATLGAGEGTTVVSAGVVDEVASVGVTVEVSVSLQLTSNPAIIITATSFSPRFILKLIISPPKLPPILIKLLFCRRLDQIRNVESQFAIRARH